MLILGMVGVNSSYTCMLIISRLRNYLVMHFYGENYNVMYASN
jgi:hypothetical protein